MLVGPGTYPSGPTPREGVDRLLVSKENKVIRVQGGIVDSTIQISNPYGTPRVYLLDDEKGSPFTSTVIEDN